MKYRYIIICVLVVFLLVAWLLSLQHSKTVSVKQVQVQNEKRQPESDLENQPKFDEKHSQSKLERGRKELFERNHRPIELYGKAIDQYGQPVMDAEVIGHVLIHDGYRETSEKHVTRTNEKGEFSLSGFKGERMGLSILKQGYEQDLRPNAKNGFIYSLMYREQEIHKPDPNNPVIFRMWKLAGPEPMIEGGGGPLVACDGTPTLIDLLTNKKVESDGDLKITLERQPLQGISRSQGFSWKSKVEVRNGGLLEINESFPYLAPETGYQASFKVDMPLGATHWMESTEKSFYIKLRGGRMYGRMKIRLNAFFDPPPTQYRLEYWLNPSGSRNLEYNPEKRISFQRIEEIGLEKALEEAKNRKE